METEDALRRYQMDGQDVPWLLATCAEHRPDHQALIWDDASGTHKTWTYSALLEDVNRLAAGLSAHGLGVGDKVLVHADNCPELVLTWFACATIGAVAVTTNTKSVAEEVAWFADKTQCVAAITQPRYLSLVAEACSAVDWIAVTAANGYKEDLTARGCDDDRLESFDELFGDAAEWQGRAIDPLLPYCIMFTSGTTSKPKGVVHTHANAIWASRTGPRNIDLGPEDRCLVYTPFSHVSAQTWSLLPTFGVGATAVLIPKWSSSGFWDVVQRHRITHFSLMPFCMPTLMDPNRPKDTTLRVGVFGLIVPDGPNVFGCDVYAAYGMTETVTHAITAKPYENAPLRAMGRVSPGYEVAVIDRESGWLCERDQPGELWLRGTRGIQLFLEYFDNPEANINSFEEDWFKTGDIVRMIEGGNLVYVERSVDLLKVGGENVSAKEVETIVGSVEGVTKVAVVGKSHEFLSEVPVAFVIKGPNAPDDDVLEKEVIEACTSRLASFKVPRAVYFVAELPSGQFDKVLKNRLREMADAYPDV